MAPRTERASLDTPASTLRPLGIALPLLGANYVAIALGGRLIFHEQIDRRRIIGIALVIIGFVIVSAQGLEAP